VIPSESVISVLAVTLIGTAGLLWTLPVGTCSQCSHCRLEKLERERAQALEREPAGGPPACPICGGRHRPDQHHER
jgi:hypothetical protein